MHVLPTVQSANVAVDPCSWLHDRNGRISMAPEPGRKQDPRPIKDKKYMNESIKRVIRYLTEFGESPSYFRWCAAQRC